MAKQEKQKMTKDVVPEGFTLGLALVDAIPVIVFGVNAILLSMLFKGGSLLFLLGGILCLVSGAIKVLWKVIVVLKKKNVWWMFMQMRIVMPLGFVLMIVAMIVDHAKWSFAGLWAGFTSMPSLIFFIIGILGMVGMGVLGAKLDSSDVKSNWIEQTDNSIAQIAICIGIIFLLIK